MKHSSHKPTEGRTTTFYFAIATVSEILGGFCRPTLCQRISSNIYT